jgi:hypothetical protein
MMSSRRIGEQFDARPNIDLKGLFWRVSEVVVFKTKLLVSGFGMIPHLDRPGTWLICGDVRLKGEHSSRSRFYTGTYSLVTGEATFRLAGEEYRQRLYSMFSESLADDLLSRAVARVRLAKHGKFWVNEQKAQEFAVEEGGRLNPGRVTTMITWLRRSYARGNREFLAELEPPRGFKFDIKTVVAFLDRGDIHGIGDVFEAFLRRWLKAIEETRKKR